VPALVAAVDVGTGSARAGLFDAAGRLLGRAERPITTHRPAALVMEQESAEIWAAAGAALGEARVLAAARPEQVAGLAFDATCSLVVRDAAGGPVTISTTGEDRRDTILWLDHRARDEAESCTATGHAALGRQGGVMSPEMALPKLMWLKCHLPGSWARAAGICDLTDFLTWKATGNPARSVCTLTCKWCWDDGWPADLLAATGLAELAARAGPPAAAPVAADLGTLTPAAAAELGLTPATRVAAGLIDAHAGALGVLGHLAGDRALLERHLALIAGTSTCLMALAPAPRPMPGIWGPYPDAILPGLWLIEGGQSASGALLDHVCRLFTGAEPGAELHARIAVRIAALRDADPDLAPELHVLPDFYGNRAPLADARALGAVSGLSMDPSFDGLCRLYWRTAVALALALRQVLDRMRAHGLAPEALHLAGGHARNPLLAALYADATALPLVEPSTDPVLLGSAMAAATAAGLHPDLAAAARAMHRAGITRLPDPAGAARCERDLRVLLAMQRHRAEIAALTGGAAKPLRPGAAIA
jgi:FGGY-family pentulose kinase